MKQSIKLIIALAALLALFIVPLQLLASSAGI